MIERSDNTHTYRLIEIWESAVKATHNFLAKSDFLFIKSVMPQFLAGVTVYQYTNKEENICGFIGIYKDSIEMLFVDEASIGQGIGKQLIHYAIHTLGCRRVTVNEQNTQALKFYEHAGFKIVGRDEVDGLGKPYPILHMSL